jgi:two-component system sensor histidine kinase DctS
MSATPNFGSAAQDHMPDTYRVNVANDSDSPSASDAPTQLLIEQLMSIARVSALEEMASGIAHELNQPLGAIATFSQAGERMLNRPEPMTSAALEVLQHINREAMNAGEGIRRIRKLFNHSHAQHPECSMVDIIQELRPVLHLLAARFNATLSFQFAENLPSIAADRLRIQHVLLTLVQNALETPTRAGARNQVDVHVTSDRYAIQVAVIDSGTGIPEHQVPQVFKPFFTTKRQGTGLGLASSRAIIEAHEGAIGFDSAEGGGTCFWFRLPAVTSGVSG